jgi:lycopene cyclase domain-containing protein
MLLDHLTRAHILRRIEFYVFLLIILGFKLLVNGYLTAKGIVLYSGGQYLGIRLGSIPLEDFFFGFSMVTMTLIFWESGKAHEITGNRAN